MKILLLFIFTISSGISLQTSNKLYDCTEVFKARKSELLIELERIDEQKQSLSALKIATEDLLKKREVHLQQKEEGVDNKLAKITQKEKAIKNMLKESKEILKTVQDIKLSKVSQTFAKMKASASAQILSGMRLEEAANILQSLKPKTVGQILTKMDSKKASELTTLLSK